METEYSQDSGVSTESADSTESWGSMVAHLGNSSFELSDDEEFKGLVLGNITDEELADDFNIAEELARFVVFEPANEKPGSSNQIDTNAQADSSLGKQELASAIAGGSGNCKPGLHPLVLTTVDADLKLQDWWKLSPSMLKGDSEMSKQAGNGNHDNPSDVSSSEDEAQDLHNSISSPGSFDSDSDKGTTSKTTAEAKSPIKAPGEANSNSSSPKDITNYMNQILRDTRYFLMKSNNEDNVELSKSRSVWSTPPANEVKINQAVNETRNVILIFSVKESGQFSGFARVVGTSTKDGEQIPWVLPPGLSNRTLSSAYNLDWISKNELSFTKTQHLFNPWNEGKPVKIGRDGQEIEPHVAAELCRLFPTDPSTDWNKITSRLQGNKVTTRAGRISAPIGGTSPAFSSNTRGFANRSPRGRFNSPMQGSSRSFDYARGRKRQFDDNYSAYESRAKRGSYDSYSRGYGDMNDRYYREPRSSFSSPQKGSSRYQDYGSREYHHPPPVAPMPYPPPPPFDNLPPPPRYYDGPPIPEFPPLHPRMRGRRSSSPYEKSVTDFIRRAGDRSHRDGRDHDRDRKYYRH